MDISQSQSVLKIATIEDSPIVANRLRSILSDIEFVEWAGNATNNEDAMELISTERPDAIILDIHLKENSAKGNGMDLIPAIRVEHPDTVILMFTNFSDQQYRSKCLALGANYFFDKTNDLEKVLDAITEIYKTKTRTVNHQNQAGEYAPQPSSRRLSLSVEEVLKSTGGSILVDSAALSAIEAKYEAAIAQQRLAMDKIEELNASLELKVKERTGELEEVNRQLDAFSYTVSHDLKSPLRLMTGYCSILLKDHSTTLNEEGKEFLQTIREKAKTMARLIDDLLRFSRLGTTAPDMKETDMNELLASVVEDVMAIDKSGNVQIIVGPMNKKVCDAALIRQVWANLVHNSLKYSSKQDAPVIMIGEQQVDGEDVYYIEDNGIGFDMKYAGKLFSPFHRLHSMDQFEGTGIGLATVHRIIEKHQGRIWAEAEVNEGATFYFTIGDNQKAN
jgi:signal transduction histidine kinase